jgi:hypothetical protein
MIMQKELRLSIGLLAVLPLLFFGCEKFDDFLNNDPLVVNTCRIESVYAPWADEGNGPSITKGTFSYNAFGQPVSVLFKRDCWTGSPSSSYLFRYDAQNRLSDYIAACGDFYDEWHVFKYNNKGLIVQDSGYYWGEMNGQHPSESDYEDLARSIEYTYDSKDRITRAITYFFIQDENGIPQPYFDTSNYVYNSDGNLNRPGATYDNKINICRTNKIWMFLHRDYSRNNYIPAFSYNEKGLPLAFPVTFDNFHFSSEDTGTIRFEYNCENNRK